VQFNIGLQIKYRVPILYDVSGILFVVQQKLGWPFGISDLARAKGITSALITIKSLTPLSEILHIR
jgi:hypothetical protein